MKQCFETRRIILFFLLLTLCFFAFLSGCASIESSALSSVLTSVTSTTIVTESVSEESRIEFSDTEAIFEETKLSEMMIANTECGKYVGAYSDGYNSFSIYPAYENSYYMDIHITRLTNIERCEIEYIDGFVRVAGKDASSNSICFSFKEQDGDFVLYVEDSTWHYLSNGESFSGIRRIVPDQSDSCKQLLIEKLDQIENETETGMIRYSYMAGFLSVIHLVDGMPSWPETYYVSDNQIQSCSLFGIGDILYQHYESVEDCLKDCGLDSCFFSADDIRRMIMS